MSYSAFKAFAAGLGTVVLCASGYRMNEAPTLPTWWEWGTQPEGQIPLADAVYDLEEILEKGADVTNREELAAWFSVNHPDAKWFWHAPEAFDLEKGEDRDAKCIAFIHTGGGQED